MRKDVFTNSDVFTLFVFVLGARAKQTDRETDEQDAYCGLEVQRLTMISPVSFSCKTNLVLSRASLHRSTQRKHSGSGISVSPSRLMYLPLPPIDNRTRNAKFFPSQNRQTDRETRRQNA